MHTSWWIFCPVAVWHSPRHCGPELQLPQQPNKATEMVSELATIPHSTAPPDVWLWLGRLGNAHRRSDRVQGGD